MNRRQASRASTRRFSSSCQVEHDRISDSEAASGDAAGTRPMNRPGLYLAREYELDGRPGGL